GAKVMIADLLDVEGKKLVDEIKSLGGVAKFYHLNVTNEQEVEEVYGKIAKEFGGIDGSVNNAGIEGASKPTHEITEKEWDAVMSVNVKGVFFCTKHVVPHMQKSGGGSVVNISSIYGLVGSGDISHYHASKGAVRLMAKNDALTYAKDNIRFNSVHPGGILTPLLERLVKEDPVFGKKLNDAHPIGHIGEPLDIANGVLFLLSDESKFMTGSELIIDGGYTCQ
nr:SDR family oxidoreductase [Sulfurospirillum sp.]